MKHWLWATVAAGLASLTAGLPATAYAQQGLPPPAVLVQVAEKRPLTPQSEFIGRAAAVDKVDLIARVKGVLGPRQFADGAHVEKDQLLFTIERGPYEAVVEQRQAQRDSAKATLANAEIALKRAGDLLRTNAGPQATYDQRLAEQLQAKAQVAEAEAQLRDAEINLSYTEIHSPITGRIGRATVSPGNIVGNDSSPLATVVSEHPMWVLFPVTQRDILEAKRENAMAPNAPFVVRLKLADGTIYKEKGKLDFFDVTVNPKTDGQIVRAVFDNSDTTLVDGQTLRVLVETAEPVMALAVPQAAIAIDQAGSYLFVVDDKNVAHERRVKTSITLHGLTAIMDGLKVGEKVIIQGQQRVRNGITVAPELAPSITPAKQ
jgi:membrane fusion protein (multidrug efflux system)